MERRAACQRRLFGTLVSCFRSHSVETGEIKASCLHRSISCPTRNPASQAGGFAIVWYIRRGIAEALDFIVAHQCDTCDFQHQSRVPHSLFTYTHPHDIFLP